MKEHRNAWLVVAVALLAGGILQIIFGDAGLFSTMLLVGAALCAFAAITGYSANKPDKSGE